jgi:hypothetical protein
MSTKNEPGKVVVIDGWARPGGFSPTGVKCLYDTNFKGEQVQCSMVIGDKAVPLSKVREMLQSAKMIARIMAELSKDRESAIDAVEHDFKAIAAKHGVTDL